VIQDIYLLVWAAVIANIIRTPKALRTLLRVWILSGAAWAVVLIGGVVTHHPGIAGEVAANGGRAQLTFGDPNLAAGYFASADHPYMLQIQDVATRAAQATVWVAERAGRIVGSVTLAVAGEPYADIALADEL